MPPFEFQNIEDANLECLESSDAKSALMQWNLDNCLKFAKFRFTGAFEASSNNDYDRIMKDFLKNGDCLAKLGCTGTATSPLQLGTGMETLSTDVMSMDFFDRLDEHDITHNGSIRGCFEEIFDGITINDKLREMLLNIEESENSHVYNESETKELIYQLFRIVAVGGSMCQPDTNMERYMEFTKNLYRDLLTVYKNPTNGEIKVSGRAYSLLSIGGIELFSHSEKELANRLIVVIDPLRKEISCLKMDFIPFW